MNRGAKAVISLALGAILMLGIYHVYRPQINSMADNTFGKVQRMVKQEPTNNSTDNQSNNNKKPNQPEQPNKPTKTQFTPADWAKGVHVELASKQTGNPDQPDLSDNVLYGGAKFTKDMPTFHTLKSASSQNKISDVSIASKDTISFGTMGKTQLKTSDIDWNSGQVRLNNNDGQYYLVIYTKATDLSRPGN